MSRYDFKLPDIGEGVTEGEIVDWHVSVDSLVREDQPLVDVMTDKATVTITSPKSGRIAALNGDKGTTVKVGAVLVVFDLTASSDTPSPVAPKPEGPAATAVGDIKESLPGMGGFVQTVTTAPTIISAQPSIISSSPLPSPDAYFAPGGKALATPASRKLARDLNVDLSRVPPTGPSGRVTKSDIRAYASRQSPSHLSTPPSPTALSVTAPIPTSLSPQPPSVTPTLITSPPPSHNGEPLEHRVPFTGIRRRIADRMSRSKNTAAHFTFVEECDVTSLKSLRDRMRPKAEAQGVKLTYLPFIVRAAVIALKRHPTLNAAVDESTNEIVYRKYYNIGIAASSDTGLVVPVVKRADQRSLLDLGREIDRLALDVKSNRQKIDDLQGSTFTITSLGAQGGLFATPIINFPEVAILGVHQIKSKPVVRDGQITIGDVMLLSLSFDHRVVDGHIGAAFAYEIIRLLEDPDRLFLEG